MTEEAYDLSDHRIQPTEKKEVDRGEVLIKNAQQMVVVFAALLIIFGGLRSLGQGLADKLAEENTIFKKFVFKSRSHHYATSTADLLTGILYAVTAIGIFAREGWAKRMNLISAAVFFGTTAALEANEWLRLSGDGFESVADTLFWSSLPIIQVVMLLVGKHIHKSPSVEAIPAGAPAD